MKLVIFDLDGTLVDSAHDIMEAANLAIQHFGHEPLPYEVIKKHIGEGLTPFIRGIAGERVADQEFVKEIYDKFCSNYDAQLLKNTTFYPGVENFLNLCLNKLHVKVGIVTNKPEAQARVILKGLGFEESRFVQIFGGDTFDVKKPNPKPLIEMMKIAGVTPHETVMIGDSRQDVQAAQAANTHFIGVSFGYNHIDVLKGVGAEKFINHFDELHPAIQTLALKKSV